MKTLTHVYYDPVDNQMVLFEATIDPTYKYIFEDKELIVNFKEFDQIENREFFKYLGTLTE